MNTLARKQRPTPAVIAFVALLLACWSTMLHADSIAVDLSGREEVPPVATAASGRGAITITRDKSVSGSIRTDGVAGTTAHIHSGRRGQTGPVVIPLTKTADNVWSVPAGTKLSNAAYKDLKTGGLYVNVNSEAHPEGEIRGQLAFPAWMNDQDVRSSGGGGY